MVLETSSEASRAVLFMGASGSQDSMEHEQIEPRSRTTCFSVLTSGGGVGEIKNTARRPEFWRAREKTEGAHRALFLG